MSNTANRWKVKGGMSKRPVNNITNTFNSVVGKNIITNSLGAELTTIDKYGDLNDEKDGAIYKFDESSINFNNVVCYYPFNNLSHIDPLPAATTSIYIKNESTFDALFNANNMDLSFNDVTGNQNLPYVVYDSQYEQNATQFRNNSKVLMSDVSFNTANIFGTTSSDASITTVMTVTSYINIPTGTEHFTIFAMDDLAQTGIQDASGEYLYLCFPGTDLAPHQIQLIYRRVGGYGMTTSLYINSTVGPITLNKWTKFQLVFGGDYIAFYIDGEQTYINGTSGGSFIPNQPISINLGPLYVVTTPGSDASGNNTVTNTQTGDTGVQLLDYKIANYALNKDLIYFLANPGVGHQFVKSRIPNGAGELIYLLSKEAILFAPPTLCQNTLSVGGQLNSYGTNNFYSQSNFYDKATFYNGIISDASNTLVYDLSAVSNVSILSLATATNEAASFMICNGGGMDPPQSNSMASMLVYNANQLQPKPPPTPGTTDLVFSISGENVSVGETFGTNTFDVSGNVGIVGEIKFNDDIYLHSTTIDSSIGIGYEAALTGQGNNSVAIGQGAGQTTQGDYSVALGQGAGYNNQGDFSIASGFGAGSTDQSGNSVAIGTQSGQTTQGSSSVAIGIYAGNDTQGENSIAIGIQAGQTDQSNNSIAIGTQAGQTYQLDHSVAIGRLAGNSGQLDNCVAIGRQAGRLNQSDSSVAIGFNAGQISQGHAGIAIGRWACATGPQGQYSIAIGTQAGQTNQGENAIAIGTQAGFTDQPDGSVAIGSNATPSLANEIRLGTASNHVVIPSDALINELTIGKGSGNEPASTAIGYQALNSNTNLGLANTAIGFGSLKFNTTGYYNTAVGLGSLQNVTDGYSNTAIGYLAGGTNPGHYNCCFGYKSQCATYNKSVAIGYNSTATADHQIILGTHEETVSIPGNLNITGTSVPNQMRRITYGTGPIIASGRSTCVINVYHEVHFANPFDIAIDGADIAVVATPRNQGPTPGAGAGQMTNIVAFDIMTITNVSFWIQGWYKDGRNGTNGGAAYTGDFSYIATFMK